MAIITRLLLRSNVRSCCQRWHQNRSTSSDSALKNETVIKHGSVSYEKDGWTNVNPRILALTERKLHLQKHHPLRHVKDQIVQFMYSRYPSRYTSPLFTLMDRIDPVVSVQQNFDSLSVPEDHVSREPGESYYLNKDWLLRAHTSAHQSELLKAGLNNYLVVGDVYRRDTVDCSHYPVFHQMEGVRTCDKFELFGDDAMEKELVLFEDSERNAAKQQSHTIEAVKLMEHDLKSCLVGLSETLFGIEGLEYRWVDTYFPFTHPSWELEILFNGEWMEVLGCGIMEQSILQQAGAGDRIGWAFGLGLERLAMRLYSIPDIRLFWSKDSGFLSQFQFDNPTTSVTYQPVSIFPQCVNDISFWIPENFDVRTFMDIVRNVGGDLVEQVTLVDNFTHPKTQKVSHCYRIVYRHMEKTLEQSEVNAVHENIAKKASELLNVQLR